MVLPTISCARASLDGGIHAVAALDFALAKAVAGLPADQARELQRTFGWVMGEVVEKIINQAIQAFPELAPDDAVWTEIVTEQARQLAARPGQAAVSA